MCRCFERGRYARKPRISRTCAQTSTRSRTSVASPSPNRPESAFATGDQPASYSPRSERDPGGVPEQQRDDDAGDPGEDQVGLAEVAALEPVRAHDLADVERRRDADEHEHGEHVHQQPEPALVAEPRKRRLAVDDADHRDHDRREQDEEAPEDERVHQAGDELLEQLALPEHDDRLLAQAVGHLVGAVDPRRLAHPDEPHEQPRAPREDAAEQRERRDEAQRAHGGRHQQAAATARARPSRPDVMSRAATARCRPRRPDVMTPPRAPAAARR